MHIRNPEAEVVKMETTQKNWITKIRISPHKLWMEGIIQVKNGYQQLKHRYRPLDASFYNPVNFLPSELMHGGFHAR
jgi:hypothetical protein